MSIAINKANCIGCGKCLVVCPGSLIKMGEDNRAFIKYPENCWGCSSCLKECGQAAISLYLGADIGGMGSRLSTSIEGDIVHWRIEKYDGEVVTIDVDRRNSNQY